MPPHATLALRRGDLVTIRSKREILASLDAMGDLDAMPFMPEMLQLCGTKSIVYKRADKTCDTIDGKGGRRLHDTVHLGALRCDGSAHGGCEAGCLLYFKEEWLRRDDEPTEAAIAADDALAPGSITEADLLAACTRPETSPKGETIYRCQATQVKAGSTALRWWDMRQYWRDWWTGNANIPQMLRGFGFSTYRIFMGIGRGYRAKVALFDWVSSRLGGIPFPWRLGSAEKTPVGTLQLEAGDWVRVKPYEFILTTIDKNNKNRGLWFDAEMVKHCGKVYRVDRKVHRIIHEKFGTMIEFKNPPVILENVFCNAEMTRWRLFCPRAILTYWRDIWLEKVDGPSADLPRQQQHHALPRPQASVSTA